MDIRELRIGNYISQNDVIKKVEVIRFSNQNFIQADGNVIYHSQIQPIPLTEDILLKCGFLKIDDVYTKSITKKLSLEVDWDGKIAIWDELSFTRKVENLGTYLHQLQNLYFALCGKELNVEL